MAYYCYLLSCRDGSLYCGWTTDLERRVSEHQGGKGGRYTRAHLPVKLVYREVQPNRGQAMRREAEIKKMDRQEKLALIREYERKTN